MGEDSESSIELVTLANESSPPVYKLRSLAVTAGSNWIETPLIDPDHPVELSAEFIFETLKYLIDSGQRLSQMTKTYDDIDAVTRLLEEKERDLELAARIGQSLLEQNNELKIRVETLEAELVNANDSVIQLKHDLASKNGLIQMYSEFESDEVDTSELRDKTSLIVNWKSLHEKIVRLEEENGSLRREAVTTSKEIEIEEKRELMLIRDCAKQLTDANLQLINLQEELSRRNDDSISQQEEITHLLSQAVELQRRCRELSAEKETLETALHISQECQTELSNELIEIKEKYELLLRAYHELQEELRRTRSASSPHIFPFDVEGDFLNRQPVTCLNYIPFTESLAAEIESSLGSEGYESELSSLNTFCAPRNGLSGTISGRRSNASSRNGDGFESPQPSRFSDSVGLMGRNKLKIVKQFEGSQTLQKWKQLATPHLGVILERHSGVKSKTLKGVDHDLIRLALAKEQEEIEKAKKDNEQQTESMKRKQSDDNRTGESEYVGKLFEPTSSIYTLTTTSLSQCKEVTIVTPSFSSLQLATGHTPPLTSVAPTNVSVSLNQMVVSSNSDFATITINKTESSGTLSTYLSNILKNTSSYLTSRSPVPTVTTTIATSSINTECQLVHSSSSLLSSSSTNVSLTSSSSTLPLTCNTVERPKNLPIETVSGDNVMKSPCTLRSPLNASFSGLAALNAGNGPAGILMRGSMIKANLATKMEQTAVKSKESTAPSTTASVTYLPGFNALLINSSVAASAASSNDKNYIGKLPTIKNLRKGGFV